MRSGRTQPPESSAAPVATLTMRLPDVRNAPSPFESSPCITQPQTSRDSKIRYTVLRQSTQSRFMEGAWGFSLLKRGSTKGPKQAAEKVFMLILFLHRDLD